MGLLKGLLSVGGGIVGGAVGGPMGAKIGSALGGAAGGALSSSSGSKKATEAQLAAIAEARRIQGEAKTEATGYQQPYMDFGKTNVNALTSRVGAGTYGEPGSTAPGGPTAPGAFSYDVNQFENDPMLQAALRQGSNQLKAKGGAGGYLNSGNTDRLLYDRGLETAYKFFNGERDFAYGQNRDAQSDYNYDRNYLTSRYDRQTDDLYRGVGVGQGAAGVASSAASRYGDQIAGLALGAGDARAQNHLTQGQIGSDFATGLGGVLSGAFGNSGGGNFNALTMPKGFDASDLSGYFSNGAFD